MTGFVLKPSFETSSIKEALKRAGALRARFNETDTKRSAATGRNPAVFQDRRPVRARDLFILFVYK
jgi:hypothetical protein